MQTAAASMRCFRSPHFPPLLFVASTSVLSARKSIHRPPQNPSYCSPTTTKSHLSPSTVPYLTAYKYKEGCGREELQRQPHRPRQGRAEQQMRKGERKKGSRKQPRRHHCPVTIAIPPPQISSHHSLTCTAHHTTPSTPRPQSNSACIFSSASLKCLVENRMALINPSSCGKSFFNSATTCFTLIGLFLLNTPAGST